MNDEARSTPLYANTWRWHFYAGLFVAPFLIILSVTGAIYLFNDELNDWIYPELRFAKLQGPALPTSQLLAEVQQAYPGGKVTRIDMPISEGRSTMFHLRSPDGESSRVFVDPASAEVLGAFVYDKTLVGFADRLHGSLMMGDFGDAIVELAACWTVVMIATGLYLWWPRGKGSGSVLIPNLKATGRRFWRDLHKVTGLWAALLILFLVLSGLPWATVWGGKYLQPLSNAVGWSYPTAYRTKARVDQRTVAQTIGEAPWTLQHAPMPISGPATAGGNHHAHHGPPSSQAPEANGASIDVDAAVRLLAMHGMTSAYRLSLPDGPTGAYTAYTYPDRPEGQRTLHLDRYTGEVLGDIRFRDYGPVAKAVEWGVAIHMGNYFGRANQVVMLLTCLMIIGLVTTGMIMWWRRRPPGRLGKPESPQPIGMGHLLMIALGLGLIFPLVGLSLTVVACVDWGLTYLNGNRKEVNRR